MTDENLQPDPAATGSTDVQSVRGQPSLQMLLVGLELEGAIEATRGSAKRRARPGSRNDGGHAPLDKEDAVRRIIDHLNKEP